MSGLLTTLTTFLLLELLVWGDVADRGERSS